METKFNRDYIEFFTSRKRWKSDFENANDKISKNFQNCENKLGMCFDQNDTN